jgi:HlyD family secretion protein
MTVFQKMDQFKIDPSQTKSAEEEGPTPAIECKNVDLSSLKIDHSRQDRRRLGEKKKRFYWIILPMMVVFIFFLVTKGWKSLFSFPLEVELVTAVVQGLPENTAILSASGYVVAQRMAAVAPKGTGRLIQLGVVEGDRVKQGQIIARLEDEELQVQLKEAKASLKLYEAELKEAKNNLARQEKLIEVGATAQVAFESAETRYRKVLAAIDLAKAQMEAAQVSLENTLIRAPFDGTVLTKNADVGEMIAPMAAGVNSRATVVTIADMDSLQAEVDVSESNIEKVRPGQACNIVLNAYPNQTYEGYVTKIVPTADRTKATFPVKVKFRKCDERVLPEMGIKVHFIREGSKDNKREKIMSFPVIPATAVTERHGKKVVYRVREDRAVETPVSTGEKIDGYVEIKEGLREGDRIIVSPDDKITDGVTIKVKKGSINP